MNDLTSAVVNHVFSACEFTTQVRFSELRFDGDQFGYTIAISTDFEDRLEGEELSEPESLIFNVPFATPHVFILITDGAQERVARIVANLEQYERQGRHLTGDSFIALDNDSYLLEHDKVGALFLPVSDSFYLDRLQPTLNVGGRSLHFLYVVFLNELESHLLHEKGRDALFEKWLEHGRGITSIDDGLESV
jgi:hypothetical protein